MKPLVKERWFPRRGRQMRGEQASAQAGAWMRGGQIWGEPARGSGGLRTGGAALAEGRKEKRLGEKAAPHGGRKRERAKRRRGGATTFSVFQSYPSNMDGWIYLCTSQYQYLPVQVAGWEQRSSSRIHESSNLDQLQKCIAQRLKSKRFLLVLDDIWKCSSEDEWKCLLSPFTKGEARGSVVLVTTRFPYIAQMVKTTNLIELQGLEHNEFFAFFEACIFADCKPEIYVDDLIDIAKEISMKLKGFPLAAKTVGRLLKKNLSRNVG
ncbi:Os02g0262600 [Oryza sativa Japonica Group]|uniref:Os02g0262600 protein n=1 Tax=Oryza sativa subsp. japonica TaxID=39947 RepID=A0A0P0VHB1_ORYSJ|nr:Os02g0262600 [Oryza sativa Japonica Group]